jgi:hypothetical protein
MRPIGDIRRGDVIITHASGQSNNPDGGPPNNEIVRVVKEIQATRRKYGLPELPVLAQGEAADLLEKNGVKVFARYMTQKEAQAQGKYIRSDDIARWHEEVCKKNGWKRPVLVSHQWHLPRAYWVTLRLCKYFDEIIVPKVGKMIIDKDNSQHWWNKKVKALGYELGLARPYHILHRLF